MSAEHLVKILAERGIASRRGAEKLIRTGVVTVGALVTMAAHLEGKGSSVLDFTGFAQKFGPVLSYVRVGQTPEAINQVRIDARAAEHDVINALNMNHDVRSVVEDVATA